MLSAEPFMFQAMNSHVPHRDNCFELLGFDILIDSLLEPWLIEVNLSPSLGCESSLDQRVKAALVSDLFTLIGVTPLDKRKTGAEASKYNRYGMGMYGGAQTGSSKAHGEGSINRAKATKQAYQEMSKSSNVGLRK